MTELAPLVPFNEDLSPIQKLSDRQRIFVWEYLKELNATKAARIAGYTQNYSGQQGFNLLQNPDIKAAILYEQTRRLAKHEAAHHRIVMELCNLAFVNMKDFYRLDADGDPQLNLADLTPEQWASIQEIAVDYYTEGKGDDAREVKRIKIKHHSKTAAIDSLVKLLGLNPAEQLKLTMEGEKKDELPEGMDATAAAELFRKMRDGS